METRRAFLTMAAAAVFAAAESEESMAQLPKKFPDPPAPAEQQNPAQMGASKQDSHGRRVFGKHV